MLDRPQVNEPKERLTSTLKRLRKEKEVDLLSLEEAFQIAAMLHDGQKRKNGEPYITHLLAACEILICEFKITDSKMVVAVLLHDSLEDQQEKICKLAKVENTRDNALKVIEKKFGKDVAILVDLLNKHKLKKDVSPITKNNNNKIYIGRILQNNETVILKLADLFHNLEDLHSIVNPDERKRMSEKYLPTLINFKKVLTVRKIFKDERVQINILNKVINFISEIEEYLSNNTISFSENV